MKYKVSIVVVAFVAGIAFMVISSVNKDSKKFYKLTELQEIINKDKNKLSDKYLIVLGNVKEGSITKNGIQADFIMEMEGSTMKVHHNGQNLLPDTFQAGAQVTVEGKYDVNKNEFNSDKVMAKCASKYQSGQSMTKSVNSKQDK